VLGAPTIAPLQIAQLEPASSVRPPSRKLARVRFRLRERGEGAISPDHRIDIAEARLDSADRIAAHKHDRAARMALLQQARVIGLRCHRRTTCSVACTPSCQAMTRSIASSTLGALLGGKSVKHGKDGATDRVIG